MRCDENTPMNTRVKIARTGSKIDGLTGTIKGVGARWNDLRFYLVVMDSPVPDVDGVTVEVISMIQGCLDVVAEPNQGCCHVTDPCSWHDGS